MRTLLLRSVNHLSCLLLLSFFLTGCNDTSALQTTRTEESTPTAKIGVLLVSHGSHSEQWRNMLTQIEVEVHDEVVAGGRITGLKSAFMEYTEPTIARRLKEFDEEGYNEVIIVPILLTVSSHSFDDIPVIAGQKQDHQTLENLKLEGIEVYKPKAKVTLAPLLDFPDVLEKNVTRRVRELSKDPETEGIVMVAYGSEPYDEEWIALLDGVSEKVRELTGIEKSEYSWCGHIAHYSPKPTEQAIQKILDERETAIVIPVLVAVDENFQGKIIGGAVKNMNKGEQVRYRRDAILPDANINRWVVEISRKLASELTSTTNTPPTP